MGARQSGGGEAEWYMEYSRWLEEDLKGQLEQWLVTSLAYVLCSQCYFCYVCKVLLSSLMVLQFQFKIGISKYSKKSFPEIFLKIFKTNFE